MKLSIILGESRSRATFSSEKQASRGLMESGASRGQLGQPRLGYPDLQGSSGGCPTCPRLLGNSARHRHAHRATAPTAPDSHTPHRPDADELCTGFPRAPECLTKATGKPLPQSNERPSTITATTSKEATPSQVVHAPPPQSEPPPRRSPDPPRSKAPLRRSPEPRPLEASQDPSGRHTPCELELQAPRGALSPVAHKSSTPRRAARVEMARGATRRRPHLPAPSHPHRRGGAEHGEHAVSTRASTVAHRCGRRAKRRPFDAEAPEA